MSAQHGHHQCHTHGHPTQETDCQTTSHHLSLYFFEFLSLRYAKYDSRCMELDWYWLGSSCFELSRDRESTRCAKRAVNSVAASITTWALGSVQTHSAFFRMTPPIPDWLLCLQFGRSKDDRAGDSGNRLTSSLGPPQQLPQKRFWIYKERWMMRAMCILCDDVDTND